MTSQRLTGCSCGDHFEEYVFRRSLGKLKKLLCTPDVLHFLPPQKKTQCRHYLSTSKLCNLLKHPRIIDSLLFSTTGAQGSQLSCDSIQFSLSALRHCKIIAVFFLISFVSLVSSSNVHFLSLQLLPTKRHGD